MRKENLYTVSLLYIRGFAESITAILFSLTKKENLYTVSLLYIQGFAESCIYNKKTGEQFRSPVFKINLVLQFLQPIQRVHPDAVLRLDGTYPMF